MKLMRGFTLVELMVVVVIIGILAAVGVPMYSDYVLRSKITEATTNLAGLRVRMEQYYQDNRTYLNAAGTACGVAMPAAPEVQYFTFDCVADANSYTITATGQNAMAGFQYTINEQNAKSSTITRSGWTGNASCWALKADGSC